MSTTKHIVIAGAGVAAVETVLALRALAGPRPRITLIAGQPSLEHRPESVATPFGFGSPASLPLTEIQAHAPFELVIGRLASVDAVGRTVTDETGASLAYDALVVAVGARPRPVLEGAISFAGPADAPAVMQVLEDAARAGRARLAFTVPVGPGWALPVYELAMLAAIDLRDRGVVDAELTVVTPERAPLQTFGPQASEAVERLLAERGIGLRTGALPVAVGARELELSVGAPVAADAVIAIPSLEGPGIDGLPHDSSGFLPVDGFGRVVGTEDVYAAGDATTFPLKQGGLSTQQADTVAEVLAAACGAPLAPKPFRPVLRSFLLTGGAPLYLRSELDGAHESADGHAWSVAHPSAEVSTRPLWWPPGKIAGRYLAPLLATGRASLLDDPPLFDRSRRGMVATTDDGSDDAIAEALLLADQEAEVGDFEDAVLALDAVAALVGGRLPTDLLARREQWLEAQRGGSGP